MITDKARDEITDLYLEPKVDRLKATAREQVKEDFCIPHCGTIPSGEFCSDAEEVYRSVVSILLKFSRGVN